jgi:prefoldin subunit 5
MLQKYKVMEQSLQRQKVTLKTKMPEITNTLDLVLLLKEKQDDGEEMIASYPLSEIVHARAAVNCNGTVCLWLGANVMVEYTYEEAIAMLERNYKNAEAKLAETNEDINHLKDQITTLEVNMARVFNYNVKAKRTGDEPADGDAKRIDAGLLG